MWHTVAALVHGKSLAYGVVGKGHAVKTYVGVGLGVEIVEDFGDGCASPPSAIGTLPTMAFASGCVERLPREGNTTRSSSMVRAA